MLSKWPLKNIQSSLERYSNLNIKAGSMKNFRKPSDDPLGVRKAMGFDNLLKQNDIYINNANNAGMYLDTTDSTILSVKSLLDSVKSLALEMRGSTAEVGNVRQSAAIEVKGILDDIKSLLNTEFHGKYIFAGHRIDSEPFVESGGVIQYRGDDNPFQLRIGPNRYLNATVPGSEFMSLGKMHTVLSVPMYESLTMSTSLDDLNVGEGVNGSAFSITDGLGTSVSFNISSCETTGDVIDMINSSGLNLMAGIDPSTNGIILADIGGEGVGEITVSEGASGSAAEDLGILGTGRDIHGSDLHPVLKEETLLSDVDALNGITLDGFNITIGGESYEVDFNTPAYPSTVGELLERISTAVPGFEAKINDSADGIVMLSENVFSVEENGSSTAASLGFAGDSYEIQSYSLFGTLNDFILALKDNDTQGIEDVIGEIEKIKDGVLNIEAAVGSRAKENEMVKSQLADSRIRLVENLSQVEDVDIAQVLTELSQAQLVYQAALQTAATIYDLSLLNYVR